MARIILLGHKINGHIFHYLAYPFLYVCGLLQILQIMKNIYSLIICLYYFPAYEAFNTEKRIRIKIIKANINILLH